MNRKEARKAYKESNKKFLIKLSQQEEVTTLDKRVLAKVIESGGGRVHPTLSDVVSIHYRGMLVDGSEFDSSLGNAYPEVFRLRELVEGMQIAIQRMVVGDKWSIYLPYDVGYGDKGVDNIPPFSTLIFEVELLAIS
ncbi:MAG: FKBP-type peptidyl-prolyl cis-trans isomerase [Rikenellaceae bacterium]